MVPNPERASARIVASLRELLTAHPAWQRIALFSAIRQEPQILSLIDLFPDRRFALPRIENDLMEFHRVGNPSQLIAGVWGIREPAADALVFDPNEIDVFLCPGLAFTAAGHRLGKGKGYYDRYFARIKSLPPRIGVTFSDFILPDLPHQQHDVPMSLVLSEET